VGFVGVRLARLGERDFLSGVRGIVDERLEELVSITCLDAVSKQYFWWR